MDGSARTPWPRWLRRGAPAALAAAALLAGGTACMDTPHYSPSRTYYVSPHGDDDNEGTSAGDAWRTLDRAERTGLEPGDRLLLKGGERFSGTVTLKADEAGDADRPVVVGSYGEGRARIDAEDGPGVSVHNTAGVQIRDLELNGAGSSYTDDGGVNAYHDRGGGDRLSGIGISRVDVSGFKVGISVGGEKAGTGFADVSVTDSRLHDNKDSGLLTYGPEFDAGDPQYAHEDVTVERVETYANRGDPEQNDTHSGNGIILGGVREAAVRDSSAHDNGGRSAAGAPAGPVGIWAYDASEVVLEHNRSYRNHTGSSVDGAGFGLDSSVSDSTVQYNLAFGNDGPGYYAYTNTANGAHKDNTIRYNVSSDDGRKLARNGGLSVHGKDIRDLAVYQNTVIMPESPNGTAPAVRLQDGERGVSFRNNLFVTENAPTVNAERGLDRGHVVFQGNNYRVAGGDSEPSFDWGGTSYSGLGSWRSGTGQERDGDRSTGGTTGPCLAGGDLPVIDSTGDAPSVVPDCDALAGKGLDLSDRFGISPGDEDYFGNHVGTPPPVGAAVPEPED
ncbi:right-handed parallel beta-helix repeat-containing protein [Streptomyces sp. HNM0574]|nr:right-handed parallel beta-helix repeat-containing protein [Streptomyces sp. HNM0574]